MNGSRSMKSKTQTKVLQNEFIKERNWSKQKIQYLAKMLGLTEGQVYKWNWDQKLSEKKYINETFISEGKKQIFQIEKIKMQKDLFTIVKN